MLLKILDCILLCDKHVKERTVTDEARESISKELRQLWEKKAWTPVDVRKMPSSMRRAVIRSSMFLKQKFDAEGKHDWLPEGICRTRHCMKTCRHQRLH